MNNQTLSTDAVSRITSLTTHLPIVRNTVALLYALRDPATPLGRKVLIGAAVAYIAMPLDLIPDFIPVIGLLDDAVVATFAFRAAMKLITPQHLALADAFLGNA